MCIVRDVINKDEQYARGWVRLHTRELTEAAHMAQYALEIQKLRLEHENRCEACQKELISK